MKFRKYRPDNLENKVLSISGDTINGGKLTKNDVDLISNYPHVDELMISGLYQNTFEYFIQMYGSKFKKIHFYKCPRIHNLKPLEQLIKLEKLEFYWNQKSEKLWDLSKNIKLSVLTLYDFNKITSLESLSSSSTIKDLQFGFFIHPKFEIQSLEPLTRMKSLKSLTFNAKKIREGDYKWLVQIPQLNNIQIPPGIFKVSEYAWLKSHFNGKLKTDFFDATIKTQPFDADGGRTLDTLIIGKRRPWLDSVNDKERITQYEIKYNNMVKWFDENPSRMAEDYK